MNYHELVTKKELIHFKKS